MPPNQIHLYWGNIVFAPLPWCGYVNRFSRPQLYGFSQSGIIVNAYIPPKPHQAIQ
jgi:hypothetical protein